MLNKTAESNLTILETKTVYYVYFRNEKKRLNVEEIVTFVTRGRCIALHRAKLEGEVTGDHKWR